MTALTDDELAARGAAIVRSVSVEPPLALRERIEASRGAAALRQRRFRLRLGLASGVAAVALAVVLALGGGGSSPSLESVTALAERPPTSSEPAFEHASVAFPDWSLEFGWRTAGQRTDELDGRSAKTAVYEKGGTRIAYTIVDGPVLNGTGGSDYVGRGRRVVTFEKNGHTCVVSAPVAVKRDVLLKLANWQRA